MLAWLLVCVYMKMHNIPACLYCADRHTGALISCACLRGISGGSIVCMHWHQAKAKVNKNNFEGLVAMLHDGASMPTLLPFKAFESLAAAMQQERALGSRLLQVNAAHVVASVR